MFWSVVSDGSTDYGFIDGSVDCFLFLLCLRLIRFPHSISLLSPKEKFKFIVFVDYMKPFVCAIVLWV